MIKKNKKNHNEIEKNEKESLSKNCKNIVSIGVFLLVLGFLILSKTDSLGQNWASLVSPFLIVSGYIVIAVGLILPNTKNSNRTSKI